MQSRNTPSERRDAPAASRRTFLRRAAAGSALAAFGSGAGIGLQLGAAALPPVSAEETRRVRLAPEIEPLVQVLESTPRERIIEEIAGRVRAGLSYRELVAALFLAGVRNIQPRPHVGFKFHAVLVVHSAHLASVSSPAADRWLPIFWALDDFKRSQASDVSEGDWQMPPVDESAVPDAATAERDFASAMEHWDEARADVAAAALARHSGGGRIFELFCRYGARDYRDLGHKAIYVANGWRTLTLIGRQHAEPVLRSLAFALLKHDGKNPAKSDEAADRPYRVNRELALKLDDHWRCGAPDGGAADALLDTLRTANAEDAGRQVVDMLGRGVGVQSVWDAVFSTAAELVLRQPGIIPLHAVTTANALHYMFQTCGDDMTRRMLLLQATSFLTLFRESMGGRGTVRKRTLADLQPAELKATGPAALEEIFADVGKDGDRAVSKGLSYLQSGASARDMIAAARRMIFEKGTNPHDYKFSSAVIEDYVHISPAARPRFLAASLLLMRGGGHADNSLVGRTRDALGA